MEPAISVEIKAEKPTDPKRSEWMGRVRTQATSAEQRVASCLRSMGLSYRRNVRSLPGSPDFANKSGGWVVFVNGCFWHHHTNCRRATVPMTNSSFWAAKFASNRGRDARAIRSLRKRSFRVAVIWECETRNPAALRLLISRALSSVGSSKP
ncbi:DNA mismatch endonuclease Vsr [Bosea sp. CS1GBMeth4]|uniref:very short patch repair endonuclease n=1 Tax=Bosea sp. CS1GBMeth4 TaxID=1892849 RepID=UPI00164491C7|nr:DNA mismatch endonuclease Vsr [Bosea sp. CS1GBMeth4]